MQVSLDNSFIPSGQNAELVLVDSLFCANELRRKWDCHQEVWAGCIQEIIHAKLSSVPPQVVPLNIKDRTKKFFTSFWLCDMAAARKIGSFHIKMSVSSGIKFGEKKCLKRMISYCCVVNFIVVIYLFNWWKI